jgi:hypothetical protein
MTGCLCIGAVSFSRCPQPTISRQNRQVFQTFHKNIRLNGMMVKLTIQPSLWVLRDSFVFA